MLPTGVLLSLVLLLQPAPTVFEEPVHVDFVLLDVVAHDRKGDPVLDLTLADFVLKENRRKVPLQSLDLESLGLGARDRTLRELDRQLERWSTRDDLTLLLRMLDYGDLTEGFVRPARARAALKRQIARNEPTSRSEGLAGRPALENLTDLEERFERCRRTIPGRERTSGRVREKQRGRPHLHPGRVGSVHGGAGRPDARHAG